MRLLGYTRVSTSSQDAQLQLDALVTAGVQKRDVFADVTSGSKTAIERRGMKKLLEHAEPGDTARFTPGESMLVHAGAGGLGSQFLQVARTLGGGRIDAVVGTPEKQTIGHRLGYDNTYPRTDLASIPDDLVIDPVGGEAATRALRMLRSGGRLIKVGNASQAADVTISSLAHWLQNKTTAGFNVGAWLAAFPEHGTHSLRWSLDAVTTGTVRVDLTRTGRWAQTTEILNKLHAGVTTGKATIRVA